MESSTSLVTYPCAPSTDRRTLLPRRTPFRSSVRVLTLRPHPPLPVPLPKSGEGVGVTRGDGVYTYSHGLRGVGRGCRPHSCVFRRRSHRRGTRRLGCDDRGSRSHSGPSLPPHTYPLPPQPGEEVPVGEGTGGLHLLTLLVERTGPVLTHLSGPRKVTSWTGRPVVDVAPST